MTSPESGPPSAGAPFAVMLRAALLPSALVGLLTVAIVVAFRGFGALPAAAFGWVVAIAFFAFGMLVLSKLVREANLHLFFAIALTVYLAQVIGLLLVILVVKDASWVDRKAMAIVVGVVTVTWQVFAIRALRTARIPVYDVTLPRPPEGSR